MVTKSDPETLVLAPVGERRRLKAAACPSLKALLLAEGARTEYLVPPRGKARRRKPVPFR